MVQDRITELRIKCLRTLADVQLRLDGLTVLIGENGTGKSTLVEVCEILRRASGQNFWDELHGIHGGPTSLLRVGEQQLSLGIRVDGEEGPVDYAFTIDRKSHFTQETLQLPNGEQPAPFKERTTQVPLRGASTGQQLILTSFGIHPPHPAMLRVMKALDRMEVHVAFEVAPLWVARATQRSSALRSTNLLQSVWQLSKLGTNLANAFAALKNDFDERHWQDTMTYVRLGLGDDIEAINLKPDPGGGSIALWIKHASLDEQLPASALSDGALVYLAHIAIYRLSGASTTLLAFDEPELHLHPELLMRVLSLYEALSRHRPVLLATHSDRLLDGLERPAQSVVLCELDEKRRTRILRPDAKRLKRWLKRYRGLGDIRSAGHQSSVMTFDEDM